MRAQACVKLDKAISVERQSVPYSYLFLGELETDAGNFDGADAAFKRAKSYSGYDYERLLSFRLASDLEILAVRRERAKQQA